MFVKQFSKIYLLNSRMGGLEIYISQVSARFFISMHLENRLFTNNIGRVCARFVEQQVYRWCMAG